MKYGFGVDLGGTTVKIAYFDTNGTMLSKWEIPTVTTGGGQQILPDIAASIQNYMTENNVDRSSIVGIGIGVPGPVDSKGVVNKCVNLGWGVFNISETLSQLTGFPVKAGNDANVAALGEYWKGGGQDCENMVFVTLGTGVAAASLSKAVCCTALTVRAARSVTWCSTVTRPRSAAAASVAVWSSIALPPVLFAWLTSTWLPPMLSPP